VYAVGHLAATKLSVAAEALLDVGDDAVLVGRSVLVHHGLLVDDGEMHVGVTSDRRPRRRPGIHMHYFLGLTGEVTDGLPMTSVARALLDVAHELPADDLGALVDEAVAGVRKTTRADIARVLEDDPAHPGHSALSRVMDSRRPSSRTESAPAKRLLSLVQQAGLPVPETEVWLHGFRVDNYLREIGLVIEVNSHTYHGLIRANYLRDQRKTRTLQAHGLEVMGIDATEIEQEPLKVIAELAAAITRLSAARAA
jgi:very-short-patch-repair endonuclease